MSTVASSTAATAGTVLPAAPATREHGAGRRRRTLVLVFDGLRPGYVRPDIMPRLSQLAANGTVYTRSRTGFPSETMVGAGELMAGAYPERSGITGNRMPLPAEEGVAYLKNAAGIDRLRKTYGDSVPVQTLFDALRGAGLTSAVVGKAGPAELAAANGATWTVSTEHGSDATGRDILAEVQRAIGKAPEQGTTDAARSSWLSAAAQHVNRTRRPDVLVTWFTDPDATQHRRGLGSSDALKALAQVDAQAGALLDALAATGELANMNVIVTSDHGFSDHVKHDGIDLEQTLREAGLDVTHVIGTGPQDLVRFSKPPTPADIRRLKRAIAESPFAHHVQTIITNPRADHGSRHDARLTGADLRQGTTARAGDVYVIYRRVDTPRGPANTNPNSGDLPSGHGSLGWSDLNNTLIVSGPDFKRGQRTRNPAGVIDVSPTVLHLHGAAVPATMQGRVLREALAGDSPRVPTLPARRNVATHRTQIGDRIVTSRLHTTSVDGTSYFDGLRFSEQPAHHGARRRARTAAR